MSETDNKITEWLRDDHVSTSSLADYNAIDNLTWLRLEKARLLKAGIATQIVVHPERPNMHALERIPGKQEG
jgi:hypothetical protein